MVPLSLAACASETTPAGYYEAARQVRLNLETPAGHVYGKNVARKTRDRLERATRRCSVRALDQRGVRLLYRLDAAGRPVESIVHPETPLARCIREDLGMLEEVELPPPPSDDYWISLPVALLAHPPGAPDP
jgi:hypothetical protein